MRVKHCYMCGESDVNQFTPSEYQRCKPCMKAYNRKRYLLQQEERKQMQKNYYNQHKLIEIPKRVVYRAENRELWLGYLTTELGYNWVCNECKSEHAFGNTIHFHHRNPVTKSFTVGSFVNQRKFNKKNQQTLKAELTKCDLVCNKCHKLLEWQLQREVT